MPTNVTKPFRVVYPGGNLSIFSQLQPTPLLNPVEKVVTACRVSSLSNYHCSEGLLLPVWQPVLTPGDKGAIAFRATIYLLALCYMIFGINVITDRILAAIEVIVSQKKSVVVKLKTGITHTIEVPVWHHVVATLSVYVIGTSTPEIFLPIAEIIKRGFQADELGPAVVVGSGAYHLLFITGVCLASAGEADGKPIHDLGVFFVTAVYAIFAYLWIYLLVGQSSPGVIELWEALSTLCLFPAIVFTAWFVERRHPRRIISKLKKLVGLSRPSSGSVGEGISDLDSGAMIAGLNERRRRLAKILHQLKEQYPNKERSELEEMAEMKLLEEMPKDAAFYRLQAGKAMSGGGSVISKEKVKEKMREELQRKTSFQVITSDPNTQYVGFDIERYTCIESCGDAYLTVSRRGAGINDTMLTLYYETFEGSAKFGEDFEPTTAKVTFSPGQLQADCVVTIIDDDEFEEDKEFLVRLSKPQIKSVKTAVQSLVVPAVPYDACVPNVEIARAVATVCILDDDHCGVFGFETPESAIADNIGTAKVKVVRSTGARGRVVVPFKVIPGTARLNSDFKAPRNDRVVFENDSFEAFIKIDIIDKNRIGDVATFYIELLEPEILSSPPKNPLGNPILGTPRAIKLGICEDDELKEALDRLLKMADISTLVGTTSWRGQFKDALKINFDYPGDETILSCRTLRAYAVFTLSLPWRLLAALTPPTHLLHGWLAFVSLLVVMAFMAAVTGDLATHFGCTVGLTDSVTAVTFIAMGMGLPDTFASRHAAVVEKTADAAIGHITGSNAVSVFLGIGMSWTLAALYHAYYNRSFLVPPGSLGLSVTLYCALATAGILALGLRRLSPVGGELGGPLPARIVSAIFFIGLWLTFVVLSILESYCIIYGF